MVSVPALLGFHALLVVVVVVVVADRSTLASSGSENCTSYSPLVGFTAELSMLQHQLRGQIEILDDCSFQVTRFDMIAGKDVYWWGSKGEGFENLTAGFVVSESKLNRTFNSESMVVRLANCSWEDFHVLGVWDKAFEADFGHVWLEPPAPRDETSISLSPSIAPAMAPAPSEEGIDARRIYWGAKQPTMFENCMVLDPIYRLRWTLNRSAEAVEIGLEAAVPDTHYMAFGWSQPGKASHFMLNADVVLGGFKNHTNAFVDDYYITRYSVCTWGKDGEDPVGVCPDSAYHSVGAVEGDKLLRFVHGQWQDGVALIRYRRPLKSSDEHYDVSIGASDEMIVVWALGLLKSPDTLHPVYLPENHGMSYGHTKLNLSDPPIDECKGPLQAATSDEPDLILAEAGMEIVVTVGPATHYPNPPNPDKVIYLNKIEAPVLKVERGVESTFSIQAGHDVPFYITSDPIGGEPGNGTVIYAGGKDAHGVLANPRKLAWKPDRFTPDEVFYQSYYHKKMGWKIRVVDGGLTDMYNSSTLLADQVVMLYWMLTGSGISFAVRGVKKSGYVALGFGERMVNTFAYVGWIEGDVCSVGTYWIDARDASSVHPTRENLTDVQCAHENGMLTFQFSRPLADPACNARPECRNIIDPSIPLKVVWAMGTQWKADQLTDRNMHSSRSSRYMRIYLTKGISEAEQALRPVLAVHGFIMFVAWAVLFPGGVLAARYMKHLKDDGWYQIHVYAQYSGAAVMFLGVLFAVAEIKEFHTSSAHVKLGLTSIAMVCAQILNAVFRPSKPGAGELPSAWRRAWQLAHRYGGRAALALGFVTLLTGIFEIDRAAAEGGGEQMKGLGWALVGWFLGIALFAVYLEYRSSRHKNSFRFMKGSWILGSNDDNDGSDEDEDDDTRDLLAQRHRVPSASSSSQAGSSSGAMEIQLQAVH